MRELLPEVLPVLRVDGCTKLCRVDPLKLVQHNVAIVLSQQVTNLLGEACNGLESRLILSILF